MKTLLTILLLAVINLSFALEIPTKGECALVTHPNDIHQSVKWYRDSAEQKALYYQIYDYAHQYVSNWVKNNHPKAKTWGVVLH